MRKNEISPIDAPGKYWAGCTEMMRVSTSRADMKRVVLIPARNDAESLPDVVHRINENIGADIVILDGGGNQTASLDGPWITVLPAPEGNGAAVREGLAFALETGYHQIFRIDGDGQHDPGVLPVCERHLRDGVDLVLGARFHPLSVSLSPAPTDRILLNLSVRCLVNRITGLQLFDPVTGYWAIRRSVIGYLLPRLRTVGYGLTIEMVLRVSLASPFTIGEVPAPTIYSGTEKLARKYQRDEITRRMSRVGEYLRVITDTTEDLGVETASLLAQA